MIDIHSHILPSLDDGASSMAETLEMCRLAATDGIHTMVATPHTHDGLHLNSMDQVRQLCNTVNDLLDLNEIHTTILPGMEVRVTADSFIALSKDTLPTLNDAKYILFEFPPSQIPDAFEVLVQKAVERGHGVILAHPEKNLAIANNPGYLFRLITMFHPWDFIIQITAGCLAGKCDKRSAKTAHILLENNIAHIMATDAHDTTKRRPVLSDALDVASRIIGDARAQQMVNDLPEAVLGRKPFPEYVSPQKPRHWWRIWG
ncbi:MAG: tyrosine-protein phosphatase [Desulfomonilaceae bacterium]